MHLIRLIHYSLALLLISLPLLSSAADKQHPLAPPDTSSPRATLQSFIEITEQLQQTILVARRIYLEKNSWYPGTEERAARARIIELGEKAQRCLDLSEIPVSLVDEAGLEAVTLLKEILDRIELLPLEAVPGTQIMKRSGSTRWKIPDTEISIERISEGPREGEYLFSAASIKRLYEFYGKVEHLPYRPDTPGKLGVLGGLYEYYVGVPGPLIPFKVIENLPDWMREIYFGEPLWQWLTAMLFFLLSGYLLMKIYRFSQRLDARHGQSSHRVHWYKLVLPVGILLLALLTRYLIQEQIHITGIVLAVVDTSLWVVFFLATIWAVLVLTNLIAEKLIESPKINPQSIDASLIRILFRVCGYGFACWLIIAGGQYLGVSLIPLLAGLGVGGLAVALAARPTLENLFGGLVLFADKPVRVGDFCRYGNKLGTVIEIGLRSTRLRSREDTIITVPNAEFSTLQLENLTQRQQTLLRHFLGLRYETTAEQLRFVLAELRKMLLGHPKVAAEPARVRFIGFGAHSLDLEIFAYVRSNDWNEFLAIKEDILLRIMDIVKESGSGFAFPSQTLYMTRDGGLDETRRNTAEDQVRSWRDAQILPFPDFTDDYRWHLKDSLDFPPKGSPEAKPKSED